MSNYIIPVLLILLMCYSLISKTNAYESFTKGASKGVKLVYDILPYILAILIAVELMRISGLSYYLTKLITPLLVGIGIPNELGEFILLRPFTGAGSLALLQDIINTYGADSYITRCACTIMGSGETVFYVTSLYLGKTKCKNILSVILIILSCTLLSIILSAFICKFL